jgi:hypothetical protein
MSVLVVLTNYSRPQNLPLCINAWRKQTAKPARIVVVDNRPYTAEERYPLHELAGADDVWRWRVNSSCSCKFAPALLCNDCEHVLFADDDLLPHPTALEHLVLAASRVDGKFAAIGQYGRRFKEEAGKRYMYGNSLRTPGTSARTDNVCRMQLVRCDQLPYALLLRRHIPAHLVLMHEDLLLNLGVQLFLRLPSYVLPLEQDAVAADLPGNTGAEALYRRPQHLAERNEFVDAAVAAGWRSLCND